MNLNILLRGQSNALLFDSFGGLAAVKAQVQALLGFDGTGNTVTLIAPSTGTAATVNSGTGFLADWLQPQGNGWQAGALEQGLLNAIAALPAAVKASPTAVVWLHNEYDSQQAGLAAATWEGAVRFDAALVRQALGQSAAAVPYLFVDAIPYANANWDSNQQIKLGMQALAADPSFDGLVAAQSNDLNMDAYGSAMGGPHLGSEDAATLAVRLARSIAESFAGYALPGSPVARAGGQLDDLGPQVVQAAPVAGHANQVLVTVAFDAASTLEPLDAVAAAGADWFLNTAVGAAGGQWASAAQLVDGSHLLLTFASPLPAGALLFYGYGYGKVWAPDGSGETHGIYDNQGMPVWTSAAGVAVAGVAVAGAAVAAPTVQAPLAGASFGSGADTLVLHLSEDAWQGDALYTVSVDGVQVGGTFAAQAAHGSGTDTLVLRGAWGGGPQSVVVDFLNDAYGGTPASDRNLYVDSISLDGASQMHGSAALLSGGPAGFVVAGAATTLSPAAFSRVWADDFSQDSTLNRSLFPVMWGDATDFRFAAGALTLTSYAAKNWQALGFLQYDGGASAGQGYGLYQVSAALDANQGPGICLCLWPADNQWPGPELDLLESWDSSRQAGFTSVHWKAADGSDAYSSSSITLDLTQRHSYALDWEAGQLSYYVDGALLFVVTGNVPLDFAHGGINETFGAVVSAAGVNPTSRSVALHLYSMSYSVPVVQPSPAPAPTPLPAPPVVGIAGSGGVVWQASQVFSGSATAGTSVQLWDGGARLGGAVTVGGNGAWAETVALVGFGAHAITATATDGFGQVATSAALGLTLLHPALETAGGTWLTLVGGSYQLVDSTSGLGPTLSYGGSPVVAGAFGGWVAIGAEADAGGYAVAWKMAGADQFLAWSTDAGGHYTAQPGRLMQGADLTLQNLETTLQQDLNGDGRVGPLTTVLEAAGATHLTQVANTYLLADTSGTGPTLSYAGNPVVPGEFGGWTLIGAEANGGGYRIAWKLAGADQYILWNTDAAGNYVSDASRTLHAADLALQQFEPAFQQDLNGDGHLGVVTTVLETCGATWLTQQANGFVLADAHGAGPTLSYAGAPVFPGEFGGWTPVGAEAKAGGYLLAWKLAGTDQFLAWNLDAAGNFASEASRALHGSDPALQALETSFQQDLNGDGQVGPFTVVLESAGATWLTQVATSFRLADANGAGPSLDYLGGPVVVGEFGGWAPIGAEPGGGGFRVAWKLAGADAYLFWNTDSAGNFTTEATRTLHGADAALQAMETSFQQDLNGDGHIGPWLG